MQSARWGEDQSAADARLRTRMHGARADSLQSLGACCSWLSGLDVSGMGLASQFAAAATATIDDTSAWIIGRRGCSICHGALPRVH